MGLDEAQCFLLMPWGWATRLHGPVAQVRRGQFVPVWPPSSLSHGVLALAAGAALTER
jgi:hypothetical protein